MPFEKDDPGMTGRHSSCPARGWMTGRNARRPPSWRPAVAGTVVPEISQGDDEDSEDSEDSVDSG